jgi:hypothetical protein
MRRTYSPYKLKDIYFSLGASTQIKIPTFQLGLLQRHHILSEQKTSPFGLKYRFVLFCLIICVTN